MRTGKTLAMFTGMAILAGCEGPSPQKPESPEHLRIIKQLEQLSDTSRAETKDLMTGERIALDLSSSDIRIIDGNGKGIMPMLGCSIPHDELKEKAGNKSVVLRVAHNPKPGDWKFYRVERTWSVPDEKSEMGKRFYYQTWKQNNEGEVILLGIQDGEYSVQFVQPKVYKSVRDAHGIADKAKNEMGAVDLLVREATKQELEASEQPEEKEWE